MNLKQIESTLTTFVHNPRPNKEPMDKNYRVTCPLYHNELKNSAITIQCWCKLNSQHDTKSK